jgi:uncharacterized protein YjbJ (UPF0337 family)
MKNWEQIAGQWKQLTGKVKSEWGKLTDDDLTNIAGKRDQLVGKVQERYGILKEDAEKQVNQWIAKIKSPPTSDERPGSTKPSL